MVKRLAGKPFTLLGINSDESRVGSQEDHRRAGNQLAEYLRWPGRHGADRLTLERARMADALHPRSQGRHPLPRSAPTSSSKTPSSSCWKRCPRSRHRRCRVPGAPVWPLIQQPRHSWTRRPTRRCVRTTAERPGWWRRHGLALLLAGAVLLVTIAVHWPVLSARAQYLDDEQYFNTNRLVRQPSFESAWRFLSEVTHPSTVNGYYQAANDDLAHARLRHGRQRGRSAHVPRDQPGAARPQCGVGRASCCTACSEPRGPPAFVGLLFGVHPTSVESVAWLAQRKNVLSAFFALLCLLSIRRIRPSSPLAVYGGMRAYTAAVAIGQAGGGGAAAGYVAAGLLAAAATELAVCVRESAALGDLRRLGRRNVRLARCEP